MEYAPIKAENVLTGKHDETISDLPYHNAETAKIAAEREKALAEPVEVGKPAAE